MMTLCRMSIVPPAGIEPQTHGPVTGKKDIQFLRCLLQFVNKSLQMTYLLDILLKYKQLAAIPLEAFRGTS